MCFYHRFAGAEHAAPHDGGPGAAHLVTAGDHHHRQGAGLDRHRGRQSLTTAALRMALSLRLSRRSPRWCTPGQHAGNRSQSSPGGVLRWPPRESDDEETDRVLYFLYSDTTSSPSGGSKHIFRKLRLFNRSLWCWKTPNVSIKLFYGCPFDRKLYVNMPSHLGWSFWLHFGFFKWLKKTQGLYLMRRSSTNQRPGRRTRQLFAQFPTMWQNSATKPPPGVSSSRTLKSSLLTLNRRNLKQQFVI